MKTIKIFISGIVQGVSFRRFIKEQADELGLKGHVRNLEDSRVEVIVEGGNREVSRMIELCRKGSTYSRVEKIEIEKMRHQGFGGFKILGF